MKTVLKNGISTVFILFITFFSVCGTLIRPSTALKKIVVKNMKEYHIPGVSIALYAQNRSHLLHFGYVNKRTKQLVNQQTVFELGSVSKIFTCLLIAQQVVEGKIALENSLDILIPAWADKSALKEITLENLCTHTAGLGFNAPPCIKSKKQLMQFAGSLPPTGSIDTPCWYYSNHGIELLRIILEESTKIPFHSLLMQEILIPLGMSPIGTKLSQMYRLKRATPYAKNGNPTIYWNHPFLEGSAAVNATSTDMLKFLKVALGIGACSEIMQESMMLTQTAHVAIKGGIQYGLGWQINDLKFLSKNPPAVNIRNAPIQRIKKEDRAYNSRVLLDKTGTTNGFHAYIAVIPAEKLGVVIMMNRALPVGHKVIRKMGRDILRLYRA